MGFNRAILLLTSTELAQYPDGRKGWAQGMGVVADRQRLRGLARSAWFPGNGTQTVYSAELVERRFTALESLNLWPQVHLHMQSPGTSLMGDPTFDAFYASNVQVISNAIKQRQTMQKAGVALLDRLGSAILIAHSQGGLMPWLIADARPKLGRGILSIEPSSPPFREAFFSNTSARPTD